MRKLTFLLFLLACSSPPTEPEPLDVDGHYYLNLKDAPAHGKAQYLIDNYDGWRIGFFPDGMWEVNPKYMLVCVFDGGLSDIVGLIWTDDMLYYYVNTINPNQPCDMLAIKRATVLEIDPRLKNVIPTTNEQS